jgi:hypothetical protein
MKKCSYCGQENADHASHCCDCGTVEFASTAPEPSRPSAVSRLLLHIDKTWVPCLSSNLRVHVSLVAMISGSIWAVGAGMIATLWLQIPARYSASSCVAGPIVGLLAFYGSRWVYGKAIVPRILWAVISLYMAAGLYGLVLGLLRWSERSSTESSEVIWEPIVACWYGITFVPILWPLFALSFLNHQMLREHERPGRRQNCSGS